MTLSPEVTKVATKEDLARNSVLGWLDLHQIKNEKGDLITFHVHQYQIAIFQDQSTNLVCIKCAQVGMSTLEILKNIRDAEMQRMDIIYTLPTDGDVSVFVAGKVNRIINNNPHLMELVADKDSIEQKQIGQSMIYFRGTWTKKAAIMITADRLVHDEKDSSKQDVVRDYQARLQHSKYKQTHVFSHPSTPNNGVDVEWRLSDQKEWFITCPHCSHSQNLSWNTEDPKRMSIDMKTKEYVCKRCHGVLSRADRAEGVWKARHKGRGWSGYHISLLMNPDVSAAEIIDKYNDPQQTLDFFYNKVLGLPYAGSGNSVTEDMIMGAVTKELNLYKGRLVIGVDTGIKLRYVLGNRQGLVGFGEMTDYMPDDINKLNLNQTLEYFLIKFPDSIMVIDQGGDIIGSRKMRQKYPGRVFLCHYQTDRKTMALIQWGKKDETGNVKVDRNRMIQLVVDEYHEKRFKLYNGDKNVWYDYYLHWSHIYRIKEENQLGKDEYRWLRSDRDDWVHATVYWRVGIDRFGGVGGIAMPMADPDPNGYIVDPDQTVTFNPDEMFRRNVNASIDANESEDDDWR